MLLSPKSILRFIKNWTLPIAMCIGALSYFIARNIPMLAHHEKQVLGCISFLQPALIFAMLFITFCKVDPRQLRWQRWHGPLLLIQAVGFCLSACLLLLFPSIGSSGVIVEGAMICMICPTATAAAVVTGKLGGDAAGLTTYTLLINLLVAVIVPLVVPLVHPHPEMTFLGSFFLIMGEVFPLLICPLLAAMLIRLLFPRLHSFLVGLRDLAFYLWAVSLALAIAVTVRSIVHSQVGLGAQLGIAAISLVCCILQFYWGRRIGRRYQHPIASCQALGQKNTVLAIWMGYTFFTPVTAIAGGFYSVWHNVFNSWQLYQKRKKDGGNGV